MHIFMSYFNVIILKYFIRLLLNLCPGPTRAKGLKSGGRWETRTLDLIRVKDAF